MTLSDLITERIIVEAKRELYLTNKTVKEIAYELGYDDEYYFSRVFKGKTDISPQLYRDTIGFNRGAS
ncbi:AraC family transcriptional regulator [Flavobacterium johnsoniae]|nr:helix-turn-helix domain-containing protein [Flavobacterium johnsoniae]WJS93302.1 AraC family transcriptional regulator [Flavobacterium johnsoniae]